jgi:hypothetical protein
LSILSRHNIRENLLNYWLKPIDISILCVLILRGLSELNEVQSLIAQLEEKRWTIAAIADSDELKVHRNTVGMWKAGTRYPRPDQPVLDALQRLLKRNRIPKMKRYQKGGRKQGAENGQKEA